MDIARILFCQNYLDLPNGLSVVDLALQGAMVEYWVDTLTLNSNLNVHFAQCNMYLHIGMYVYVIGQ